MQRNLWTRDRARGSRFHVTAIGMVYTYCGKRQSTDPDDLREMIPGDSLKCRTCVNRAAEAVEA